MAGIGFALNKLVNKKNFLGKVSGYFYATSSCLGSMILGFILIFSIQYVMKIQGQTMDEITKFTAYVTNIIFSSMIVYSLFSLVVSRYLSDMMYTKKYTHIMASFWGVISLIIPISVVITVPILIISKIELMNILVLTILLSEFVVAWVATLYVTILKKYKKITMAYFIGLVSSLILLYALVKMQLINLTFMLIVVAFSYGIVLLLLMEILQKEFKVASNYSYEFTKWFSKYPELLITGFCLTLGTLIHFYIMWYSKSGQEVQGLIHRNTGYDLPAILAYFSTIITSITFVVVLEPHFYVKYARFFSLLNKTGTYKQLEKAKGEMQKTLKIELRNLILKQIICTLFFVIIISPILENLNIGFTKSMIECFKILCIGYSLFSIGNVLVQLQLYFSNNKGACRSAIILLMGTILGSFVSLYLGETFYGLGIIVGGALMACYASVNLENYIENIEYNILNMQDKKRVNIVYLIIKKTERKVKYAYKNRFVKAMVNILLIVILSGNLVISVLNERRIKTRVFIVADNETVLHNEGVGLAPWAKSEGTLEMDTSLVYIDLSWADWEPKEGKFNVAGFESKNHIAEYKAQGRKAVFRFYMDYPSDKREMDIPDWLYKKIKQDGTWYNTTYGKGFSPNYSNETLIKYHSLAIQKLAELYGNDDFLKYIELGSIGHWGEWHVDVNIIKEGMPSSEIRKQYVEPYITNFKNSEFLLRYPVEEALANNAGLYNDMTGDEESTNSWINSMKGQVDWEQRESEKLVNCSEAWKENPIGGEFASTHDIDYYLNEHLDMTLLMLEQSHQSFIGPKILIDEADSEGYSKKMEKVLKTLGYRLYAKKTKISQVKNDNLDINLEIENSGNAPIYNETQLVISLYNANGEMVRKEVSEDFDARKVMPNETAEANLKLSMHDLEKGEYTICISFEYKDSEEAKIQLPMEEYNNKEYKIGQFSW